MKRTGVSSAVIGLVAAALVMSAVVAPVVSAQDAPAAYAAVAGRWAGYVTWPSGGSSETIWTINPDGMFSIQTDRYTAVGSLTARGADYTFSYERNGETWAGTLAADSSNGQSRLVGRGEAPNGPMNVDLTRS